MILGLDVGERRIGVAVSDPSGTFLFPVTTIERTTLEADLVAIVELAEERMATTIVVGDPISLNGTRGPQAALTDAFCAELARVFKGTLDREDERLTTASAASDLAEAQVPKKKRKGIIDQLAALHMLESYVARRRSKS